MDADIIGQEVDLHGLNKYLGIFVVLGRTGEGRLAKSSEPVSARMVAKRTG